MKEKEVVTFGNVQKAREISALFDIDVKEDHLWSVPALRVKGEITRVRGFQMLLKALDNSVQFID
jgi:hypothetical protein